MKTIFFSCLLWVGVMGCQKEPDLRIFKSYPETSTLIIPKEVINGDTAVLNFFFDSPSMPYSFFHVEDSSEHYFYIELSQLKNPAQINYSINELFRQAAIRDTVKGYTVL